MTQQEQEILIADYLVSGKCIDDVGWLNFTTSLDSIDKVLDKIVSEKCNVMTHTEHEGEEGSFSNIYVFNPNSERREIIISFNGRAKTRLEAIVLAVIQYIEWKNKQQ